MLYFKRLLKRKSYIFFLCTVIGIVFISNSLSDNENSALKIALCQEDSSSVSDKAIKFLLDKNTIMKYLYYENISDAEKAVENHKVDAVWIFRADPVKRISGYVSKKSTEPFIRIIEREENTLLRMEREALISSVFEEVSFWILNNCAGKNSFDEAELRKIYAKHRGDNNFIEIQKLNTQKSDEEKNLIFSPMKGICALVVLFAGLVGAMNFLKDTACGIYDWIPTKKSVFPAFVSCFTFSFLTGIAVTITNCFLSFSQGVFEESMKMLSCIIATTGFCLNFCFLFKSYEKMGAFLPGIITAATVLSPIFIDIASLKPLQMVFPPYYYLNSNVGITTLFLYCIFIYSFAFILNFYRSKKQIV